jgi:hypothetical protein
MSKPGINVVVTGSGGLVGSELTKMLSFRGHPFQTLSLSAIQHNKSLNQEEFRASVKRVLSSAQVIVHLAGANIGSHRWSTQRKEEILSSRVQTCRFLFDMVKGMALPLKAFITASAVGYYGTFTSCHVFHEEDLPGRDFLGQVCRQWEEAANCFEQAGIRTVALRTGMVLSDRGGALPKLALPVSYGLGAVLGSGQQYMPWIHIHDLCQMYIRAIEDISMQGAYNAVAPECLSNKEFSVMLADILHKPIWLPAVPSWLLRAVFGEMASVLLYGSRVSASRILASGYRFLYPDLRQALSDLYRHKSA